MAFSAELQKTIKNTTEEISKLLLQFDNLRNINKASW